MSDDVPQIGDDPLTDILKGTRSTTVQVDMLEEFHQELLRLASENDWSEKEAISVVLANGLAYLRCERELGDALAIDGGLDAAVVSMVERYAQTSSMYAALKFRAYYLAEDRHKLELMVNALRIDNEAVRRRNAELREELSALRSVGANRQLDGELPERAATSPDTEQPREGAAAHPLVFRILRNLLLKIGQF